MHFSIDVLLRDLTLPKIKFPLTYIHKKYFSVTYVKIY
jgi:hypothetical protein